MSVKPINKDTTDKGNRQSVRRSNLSKPVVFQKVSNPSPLLSDANEFPSLKESSVKSSNSSFAAGKIVKYSDKLKSQSLFKNPNTLSKNFSCENNTVETNVYHQIYNKNHSTKISNNWNCNEHKNNFSKKEASQITSEGNFDKPRFVNKVVVNANQNISRKQLKQSPKTCSLSDQQLECENKKELPKQKHLGQSLTNSASYASCSTSHNFNSNLVSKPNSHNPVNKSGKLNVEKNESKEESDSVQCNKEKKKKNRKSKVKRQVALQSGKLTVLTPEVHSRILNQTSALTSHNSASFFTDINDEEEYPELGKPILLASLKANHSKKDISVASLKEAPNKPLDVSAAEDKLVITKEVKEAAISEKRDGEKKAKSDSKVTVHNPITVSLYDMLTNKSSKQKVRDKECNIKDEINIPDNIGLGKIIMKKDLSRPHNLLDSSSPMVKRGKEREKPKVKKPSQLKKIILYDRRRRKEQLLHLQSNNSVANDAVDCELENKVNTNELNCENVEHDENEIPEENSPTENNSPDIDTNEVGEFSDETLLLLSDNSDNLQDELVFETEKIILSESCKELKTTNDLSSATISDRDIESNHYKDNSALNLSPDKANNDKTNNNFESSSVKESLSSVEIPSKSSSDSFSNSLISSVRKVDFSDKERAAKILLHTRNFREYCNHLISKDIDDAVYCLLDDLARFQDRLHQKDPIKARMKKRMINGVKEVKKYIKLRKLKCIIIAVDIENVEAQGGLNDVLNDIKTSAADHHIPCVFALSRKVLGKVCHKPVPVSCVGVFNYEGSEVNFKKMVELQTQSKADYNEIFNNLILKLTDQEAATLLKAKAEAPETLRVIRTDILNDFFMKSKTNPTDNENMQLKSSEQMSDLIDM